MTQTSNPGAPRPVFRHGRIDTLDGVRGLAILLVIAGHIAANAPGLSEPARRVVEAYANSSLGVRLFFVLSGYLITTLMLVEQDRTGGLDVPAFYRRRIVRIFPAFYAFLAGVVVFNLVAPIGLDRWSLLAAGTFSWNYARQFLVIGPAVAWMLGHLWTLALEQQFYLFWPVFVRRLSRRGALLLASALVAWCPIARLASYALFPSQRGYLGMMFHTAIDSLMVGCAAALLVSLDRSRAERNERWRTPALILASGWLLLGSPTCALVVRGFPVAGGFTLDALACSVLIVHLHLGPGGVLARVFGAGLLPKLGLISYSLYLWQQMFLRPDGPLGQGHLVVPVAGALAAATASYFLVERPILERFSGKRPKSRPATPTIS